MSEFRYITLDVFTDTVFGGNQLAVFLDANGIPEDRLLKIAQEFNYSETTFCYPPIDPRHTARVRIFTPASEVPFAGHPTVGTAIALAKAGRAGAGKELRTVLEEGVGPVNVLVRLDGDAPFAQLSAAKMPEIGPPVPTRQTLAELLSLEADDFVGGTSNPQAVSCGLPFIIVPLKTVKAVSRSRLRSDKWEDTLKAGWAKDLFVFAKDPAGGENHYRARCYVPGFAVPEDPATGSANACFAGYLAAREHARDGTFAYTVDQGVEMGRPSRIEIEADKKEGVITAIRVGGRAVFVLEGVIRV